MMVGGRRWQQRRGSAAFAGTTMAASSLTRRYESARALARQAERGMESKADRGDGSGSAAEPERRLTAVLDDLAGHDRDHPLSLRYRGGLCARTERVATPPPHHGSIT